MKILLTGGNGFFGRHVQEALKGHALFIPRSNVWDLRDPKRAWELFDCQKPDAVVHLAAVVGGIGYNTKHPAKLWRDNTLMGVNVLHAAHEHDVGHVIMAGTTCSYPLEPQTIPFIEDEIWSGHPEPTNAPYGIAKRGAIAGGLAYHREHGLRVTNLIFANLYGPGDNFDPASSHVIPAILLKIHQAVRSGNPMVSLWGTGQATRDFLYVEDAARAIASAIARPPPDPAPINVGSGREVSIAALAAKVVALLKCRCLIRFDSTMPEGQPRRALDITRAQTILDWRPETPLDEGLRRTWAWYLDNREVADGR